MKNSWLYNVHKRIGIGYKIKAIVRACSDIQRDTQDLAHA